MSIDDYVRDLDRRLVGPRRAKSDLLAEAHDSLIDATEAYQASGMDRAPAEARAITEFGAANRIAPAYQRELAVSAARRLALLAAAVPVAVILAGDRMWQGSPWTGAAPPAGYGVISQSLDLLAYPLGGAAVLALLALRHQALTGGDPRRLCRALGLGTIAALGVTTGLGSAIYVGTVVTWPAALTWPPMIVGGTALAVAGAWQLVAARRCLHALRPLTGADA